MRKLKLFFACLLMAVLSIGQMWGADVEVSFASWTVSCQTYSSTEWTDNGCTFTYASNNQTNWSYVRCGGKSTSATSTIEYNTKITVPIDSVVLSTPSGIANGNSSSITITGIEVAAYRDAGFSTLVSSKDLGTLAYTSSNCPTSIKIAPTTAWAKDLYYKISISWTATGSKNCGLNVSSIKFWEHPATPSYDITAASNNNSYGTVALSGSVITATANSGYRIDEDNPYTISPDGSATVVRGTGTNINKFTVTPSANTTVTINFKAIPTHNIIFNNGGVKTIANAVVAEGAIYDITETIENSLIASCTYKKFEGWTRSSSIANANVKPTLVTSVEMEDEDINLYAVYSITTGGGGTPTAYSAGDEGDFVIASYNTSDSKWYAIPTSPTLSSGKIAGVAITVNATAQSVNYVTSANASGYTWTIANATNGQTLSDGTKTNNKTNYLCHSNGGGSGTNLAYGDVTYTWNIASETNGLTFQAMNGSTTNTRGMLMSGTNFGGYALSNEDATGYYRIQVLPIVSSGTTTYSLDAGCAAAGQCFAPTFEPTAGTFDAAQSVELATTTDGATIYYTTNGNDPEPGEEGTIEYTAAISVTQNTTIKAIAIKGGMTDSEVSTGEFKIRFATAPTFGPTEGGYTSAQSVTMAATGAEHIYYTMTSDGSTPADPTIESPEYTSAIALDANGTYKFKAIAVKAGFAPSNVESATYTLNLPYANIKAFIEGEKVKNANNRVLESVTLSNAIITGRAANYNNNNEVISYTLYVQDETAGIMIYALPTDLDAKADANHSISGTIKAMYTVYRKQHEMAKQDDDHLIDLSNVTFSDNVVDRPVINSYTSLATAYATDSMKLVKLTNVMYASKDDKYNATFSEQKIYNTFKIFNASTVWPESNVDCDITGIVIDYNGTYELLPVFASDVVADADAAAPVFTPAGGADAANAVQVDMNSYVNITAADAKHSVNIDQVQITSTDPVSVTAVSSRDFYRSTSVTKWYYGNSASASYDINGQGLTTEGTIVAQVNSVDAPSAKENDEVHILITPNAHYELATIKVNGNDPTEVSAGTEYKFTMPDEAVTIVVTWNEDAKVDVQFAKGKDAATGDVPSTMSGKYENDVITLPANPFTLASWKFKGWKHSLTDAIHQPGSYTITAADVAEDAITFAAEWEETPDFEHGDWTLVTDSAELAVGSYVIIANVAGDKAMKSYASGNNCPAKGATVSGNLLTYDGDFAIYEIKEGTTAKKVAFYDINTKKYIYAASGSNNHMKAETTLSGNSSWAASIESTTGEATLTAQGTYSHNEMHYNPNSGNPMFSCYSTGASTGTLVALYKYHVPSLKLTYDKNAGDDVVTGMPSMQIADGENKVTISDATPLREGYLFDGWKDGEANDYEAGQEYTLPNNLTIYAQWQTATAHSLSYDKDGGEGDVPAATTYYPYVNVTLANAVTKEGYIFAGWEYDGNIYAAGTSFTMPNDAVVMKAKYVTGAVYTIMSRTEVTAQGAPAESTATFVNTYENDKSQMTSGNSMTLTLTGYDLYTIKAITLRMKSNASKGYGTLSVTIGGNPVSFTTNKWYDGEHYSSSYEDIKVTLTPTRVQTDKNIVIEIVASQNSLYCQSFAIEYERVLDDIRTAGVAPGVWGTICPKKEVKYPAGASFYEISYVEYHSSVPYKVFYDEIAEGASLTAGHPYLFQADEESTAIKGIAVGDDATSATNDHGFIGVLENETISVAQADVDAYKYYIVYNNEIRLCGVGKFLIKAERAYLDMSDVEKQYKAPIAGRRRVALTNNAAQNATGCENINASETPVKMIIDGQLYILRGEKLFDATGHLVK